MEAAKSGHLLLALAFGKLKLHQYDNTNQSDAIFRYISNGLYNVSQRRRLAVPLHVEFTEIPFLGLTLTWAVSLYVGFCHIPLLGRLLPNEKDRLFLKYFM